MALESHQIKLLQQNAKQVYDIVTATFGRAQKHPHPQVRDCKQTKNDGELLHCLWSSAVIAVGGFATPEEKIDSLLLVRSSAGQYTLY
jgi:hypothetical protein